MISKKAIEQYITELDEGIAYCEAAADEYVRLNSRDGSLIHCARANALRDVKQDLLHILKTHQE